MDRHDVLQHIPLVDYDEFGYEVCKEMHFDRFNEYLADGCDVIHAVNNWYYHGYDAYMDKNGMDKFVAMIAGMLFMIEHNEVEIDQAYGTNYDINDFETGEYDNLFTDKDLKLIKKDIKIIKDYLEKHPELLEE